MKRIIVALVILASPAHGQQAACSTYSGGFTYCSDGTSVQSSDGFDYVTRPEPSVGADQGDSQDGGE